jgi:hypothetical protein
MITLGIICLILALLSKKLVVLWGVGCFLILVGIVLEVLGAIGRTVGGRRHYY